jgi:hypothetical protein
MTPGGGQMMETRISDELAQSSRPKGGNSRGVARNLWHSLAEIGAAVTMYFWGPDSASDVTAENSGENTPGKASLIAPVIEDAGVKPSVREPSPAPVTPVVMIGPAAATNRVAHPVPNDQEIQRRRDLVRVLFNDFWSEAHDKPAAFVDRLAQAEPYINERLTACGEFWQLDAETRKTLGLPFTKNSANPRAS